MKDRQKLITQDVEQKIYALIREQFKENGCTARIINGMPDHVHCLFLLNSGKSISEIIKQTKGSTSHTINQSNLFSQKFAWQTGYAAFSVSESVLDKVIAYIENQKHHHKSRTFQDEFNALLKLNGLDS
ncbi:MAG: IS200/IS605 family transposase [Hymenobacteraceae bacterium]|nr:IS200/IS605 family transposase [Hymenobacteraceae bacterium]MDX5396706.1 IS200/IS605 family transposase [Hymenobacteraceae bacterium]MDX5512766.1 IS200/IS605 family transposase [Hymenobacteraceae bacterium]